MTDFAEHIPPLTDNDALLALARHPDQGMDVYAPGFTAEMLHLHADAVGQFPGQLAEEFFPDAFGHHKALAAICDLVFGKKRRGGRQFLDYVVLQLRDIVALARRDRDDVCKATFAGQGLQTGQEGRLVGDQVHLVDGEYHRAGEIFEFSQHELVIGRPSQTLDEKNHDIHVLEHLAGRAVHIPVHGAAVVVVQTRGVHINELGFLQGVDAEDAMASGLGAPRGNADLLTDEPVHQCRLAGVGPADEGDVTAAIIQG